MATEMLQHQKLIYTLRLLYSPIDDARFIPRNRRLLNLGLVLPNLSLQVSDRRFNLLQQIPAPIRSMQHHGVGRIPPLPNP